MKTKIFILIIFCLSLLYSCKKKEESQFTFYLEYFDSVQNCKTCSLFIDGQEKFSNQLCFKGVTPNATIFSVPISTGNHTIKAEIKEDSKIFEQVIKFTNNDKFGYLTYNTNSGITFTLSPTGGID